jgi:hypothetical protein
MKYVLPATLAATLLAGAAIAQTTQPAQPTPSGQPTMTSPTQGMGMNNSGNSPTMGSSTGTGTTLGASGNTANPPRSDSAAPAAVTTTTEPSRTTQAPVAGANSFTEGQARSRIEDKGFTNVTDLKKDDKGVWRASAQKDGKTVTVALDYQGNIVTQ